jgi:hypothetical protein
VVFALKRGSPARKKKKEKIREGVIVQIVANSYAHAGPTRRASSRPKLLALPD